MRTTPRRGTAIGTVTAVLLLLAAAPTPVAALRRLQDAGSATDPTAPLVAASALAAWGLAAWLAGTVLVTVAGHLPGVVGTLCAGVSRRIAPAAVRRAVEVALGLTVAVGVLGSSPASAASGHAPAPASQDRTALGRVNLDWSSTPAVVTGDLDWPGSTPVTGEPVLVRPGDCLWAVARQQLQAAGGPAPSAGEIAQAWPRWWAANRDVVGDDPDLIRPGMRLSPPAAG